MSPRRKAIPVGMSSGAAKAMLAGPATGLIGGALGMPVKDCFISYLTLSSASSVASLCEQLNKKPAPLKIARKTDEIGFMKTTTIPKREKPSTTKPAARKNGRPSGFTPELADKLCEQIASGKSNREACKTLSITNSAMYSWLQKNREFQEQYAHAREMQADLLFGEIIAIADELEIEATYRGGTVKLDVSAAAVARARLRIDARKWMAAKLAPKKYGDKLQVGGTEDLPAVKHESMITLTPDEAYKRMLGMP
jgi:hypothetical protein